MAGSTAFVIGAVFAVSAAQTYLTEADVAFGVQSSQIGMALGGLTYHLLGTRVPNVCLVPDVFVALFFKVARDKLQEDIALAGTLVFAAVSQVALGLALAVVGKVKLLRISNWIPYPVARGLLAGVGVCVVKMGIDIVFVGDVYIYRVVNLGAAGLLALALRTGDALGLPQGPCFVGTLGAAVVLFHVLRPRGSSAFDGTFLLDREALRPNFLEAFTTVGSRALHQVNGGSIFVALGKTAPSLVSMVLVILLKESLSYSTMDKVVQYPVADDDDNSSSSDEESSSSSRRRPPPRPEIDAERELRLMGCSTLVAALCGGLYSPPSIGPMIVVQDFAPRHARGPGLTIVAWAFLACFFGLGSLAKVLPTFCCGGLLLQAGFKLVETQLVLPYAKLPRSEWLIILAICAAMPSVGLLPGVGLGMAASLVLFAQQYMAVGGIKYACDGTVARSVSERDERDDDFLRDTAHDRHYLQLHGYIFFGNVAPVLAYAKFIIAVHLRGLQQTTAKDAETPSESPLRQLSLTIDMTFVTALDASAVDVFEQVATLARDAKCSLSLCGLEKNLERSLRLGSTRVFEVADVYADADRAIDAAEVRFLRRRDERKTLSASKKPASAAKKKQRKAPSVSSPEEEATIPDFIECLRCCAPRGTEPAVINQIAQALTPMARLVLLRPGDRVQGDTQIGATVRRTSSATQTSLYFVARGRVVVQRDPDTSVATLASQTVLHRARRVATLSRRRPTKPPKLGETIQDDDKVDDDTRRFRIAEYGAGAVCGVESFVLGYYSLSTTVAVTPCVLYAVSYDDYDTLRTRHPDVALSLLHLCAVKLAKHNETSYEQLSLLRDAFLSPPPTTGHST